MIPQDYLQTLLDRTDIVDVVERYVPLKKAGANFQARCPFHNEKSPSFTVSPTKQFYHCFGCGAHGTAITFLMEHAGMGFIDAVKELSSRVGMQVPEDSDGEREEDGQRAQQLTAMERAAEHFRTRLKGSEKAVTYLKSRGLTGQTAARFGLGYADDEWQGLAATFPDYHDPQLETVGLVIAGDSGKRYDRFRDRVMFPIRNERGQTIAFGGRVIGKGEPKYLNSPETPLFHKGRELYGLFEHRRAIQKAGEVLVVEGYMDVVMLAQHGVENAVATLGTAVTPDQVSRLLRLADNIIFAFDGDAAGRKAAWRALENALPQIPDGKRAAFLFLPEGEDPDSFVRGQGAAAFRQQLAEAMPLSEFLLQNLAEKTDLKSQEGKVRLMKLADPYLRQLEHAPMLARVLRQRLVEFSGLSFGRPAGRGNPRQGPSGAPFAPSRRPQLKQSPRRILLLALLQSPARAAHLADLPSGTGNDAKLVDAALDAVKKDPTIQDAAQLLEAFAGHPLQPMLRQAVDELRDLGSDFDGETDMLGALDRLREQAQRAEIDRLSRKPLAELSAEERERLINFHQRLKPGGG